MEKELHRRAWGEALESHRVAIVVKGQQRAVLAGRDLEELRHRAFTFAAAQGWRRAVVEVIHGTQ
ncbi:hypothetical protein [Halomonas sp. LBP4]|uniref:hypothetical protein n=1 Tax=Halomonas sp. LBP4 TaxID=2044917 RepID=UPI000D759173|nr:hypothetical protein [Halomonas sp. LBP4]PXX97348.1 hypothetical protein CR157_11480 [Halomonas sp. LBP4]